MRTIQRRFLLVFAFFLSCACLRHGLAQVGAPEASGGAGTLNGATPWAMDTYNGKQELVPIHHATVTLNRHTGRNIAGSLAGSFFYRPEMTTELAGEHAKAQLHTLQPLLYLHVEQDEDPGGDDSGDKARFEVVPAKVEKGHRVVTQMNFNQFTTHAKRKQEEVPIHCEKLQAGWVRLTVQAPLAPGEYVLLAQPVRGEEYTTTVFPFAIDEKAPESAEAKASSLAPQS